MIRGRFLSRREWEKRLRRIGAEPLDGMTALNSGEWWKLPGKFPFTVPVEDDGDRADFWAIQKLCEQLTGPMLFKWEPDDGGE